MDKKKAYVELLGYDPSKNIFEFCLFDEPGDVIASCDVWGQYATTAHLDHGYSELPEEIPDDSVLGKAFDIAARYFASFVGNVEIVPG